MNMNDIQRSDEGHQSGQQPGLHETDPDGTPHISYEEQGGPRRSGIGSVLDDIAIDDGSNEGNQEPELPSDEDNDREDEDNLDDEIDPELSEAVSQGGTDETREQDYNSKYRD